MKQVPLYILIAAFFFGTMEVSLKLAGNQLEQLQLTFLRFMVGGLLLLPLAFREIKRNKTVIRPKDYAYMLLLGTVCIPLSMVLFQLGVMKANASTAAIIMCVNPLFTMFFAHFLIQEKMKRRNAIALVLSIAGIVFMINPFNMQEGNTIEGILMVLGGAFLFGLYSVLGKVSVARIGLITQTSISFILGSLVLLVILLITDKPILEGVWPDNFMLVIYLSVFVTGLAYVFYFKAIDASNATTGSATFLVKAGIAPVLAVIILKESLKFNSLIGIALVLAGASCNIFLKDRLKPESPQEES
ncbi:DMT family transporter [Bacillota bacterium]